MNIGQRIKSGEDIHTEFKTSFGDELIVTLVAFANGKGGEVFVGITDTKKIVGVEIGKETVQHWITEIKTKPFHNLFLMWILLLSKISK